MPPRAQHGITNFVIGALDVELENYLKEIAPGMGIRIAILSLNSGLTTGDYGWNTPSFKRMAKFKFLPVQASPHGLWSSLWSGLWTTPCFGLRSSPGGLVQPLCLSFPTVLDSPRRSAC